MNNLFTGKLNWSGDFTNKKIIQSLNLTNAQIDDEETLKISFKIFEESDSIVGGCGIM